MIEGLNSDKVKLEQHVAKLEELLAQKETQTKRGKKKKKKLQDTIYNLWRIYE